MDAKTPMDAMAGVLVLNADMEWPDADDAWDRSAALRCELTDAEIEREVGMARLADGEAQRRNMQRRHDAFEAERRAKALPLARTGPGGDYTQDWPE